LFHSPIFLRRSDSRMGTVPQFNDFSSLELSAAGSRLPASQMQARARVPVILLLRIFLRPWFVILMVVFVSNFDLVLFLRHRIKGLSFPRSYCALMVAYLSRPQVIL
jgi:hypothetical protein